MTDTPTIIFVDDESGGMRCVSEAEYRKLERELAEAKRDAARYRWLREKDMVPYPSDFNPGELQNLIVFWDDGQSLDAAIDAAMKEGK